MRTSTTAIVNVTRSWETMSNLFGDLDGSNSPQTADDAANQTTGAHAGPPITDTKKAPKARTQQPFIPTSLQTRNKVVKTPVQAIKEQVIVQQITKLDAPQPTEEESSRETVNQSFDLHLEDEYDPSQPHEYESYHQNKHIETQIEQTKLNVEEQVKVQEQKRYQLAQERKLLVQSSSTGANLPSQMPQRGRGRGAIQIVPAWVSRQQQQREKAEPLEPDQFQDP